MSNCKQSSEWKNKVFIDWWNKLTHEYKRDYCITHQNQNHFCLQIKDNTTNLHVHCVTAVQSRISQLITKIVSSRCRGTLVSPAKPHWGNKVNINGRARGTMSVCTESSHGDAANLKQKFHSFTTDRQTTDKKS